jgi:endonuclease/exonuclease/phosphatase family metal-dependent hydrolase
MSRAERQYHRQYCDTQDKDMKLVTFNIRCDFDQDGPNSFRYRKEIILEKIRREAPDILCFQEVLPHVATWLKENLSDYYVIGCGRDEKLLDEQTSIAYKKTVFNLMQMDVFWLSETPKVPGSRYENQSVCPRVCTMALFQNLETREVFRIYNTHLDHIGSEARRAGLSQILERIASEEAFVSAPVILTGDFNAFPGSEELKVLENYPELVDLTEGITGTYHEFGTLEEPEKIDYIIVSDTISCSLSVTWEDCKNGVYLSDHYPVCVEIQFKQKVSEGF